ncbi:hypothetical protein MIND_00917300 [Mycena indigotica]|uniref:Uncharacterized protein n=1 Tax=Mycena indigotica TaxID=2126181 RepID=A0A8H6SFF2_9AGAR|nr:uncharacterized protein MIND_00917300 [Mycena indigotica]KAF7296860.1 hypothetical protein MIND_00917300 [Mycena indigotica]
MPPLTRTLSGTTIRSWWSDNNTIGVTINLHAVAKPLIRALHGRQARSLLKASETEPLSIERLELYVGYLRGNYIASSAKARILQELEERIRAPRFDGDVKAILYGLNPLHMDLLCHFLASEDPTIKLPACYIAQRVCIQTQEISHACLLECAVALLYSPYEVTTEAATLDSLAGICWRGFGAEIVANVAGSAAMPPARIDQLLSSVVTLLVGAWSFRTLCEAIIPGLGPTDIPAEPWTVMYLDQMLGNRPVVSRSAIWALRQTIAVKPIPSIEVVRHAPDIINTLPHNPARQQFACWFAATLILESEAFPYEGMERVFAGAVRDPANDARLRKAARFGIERAATRREYQLVLSRVNNSPGEGVMGGSW